LAQRFINVRGFYNVGPTFAQCLCFGWENLTGRVW